MRFSLLAAVAVVFSLAAVPVQAACTTKDINTRLASLLQGQSFDAVRAAPIKGWCEASVGSHVYYVREDGGYLMQGDLVSVGNGLNLTAVSRARLVKGMLDKAPEKNMVVIKPKKVKATVTVFTDVECPYCARFHKDVPKLNAAGVAVRYLLFARGPKGSANYKNNVSVWCAADRAKAIGIVKGGGKVPQKDCANPIQENIALGVQLGVTGTPTIVLEDGRILGGYVPPEQLLVHVGLAKHAANAADTGKPAAR